MSKTFFTISLSIFIIVATFSLPTVSKLRRLLGSELHSLETLRSHVYLKENRLKNIASQLELLSAVVSGRGARDEYLNNPLHTVTLVRRLTTDWLALANLIGDHSSLSSDLKKWAELSELQLVVRNLARVQLTYNLSTDHLADSVLVEIPVNDNLTGADCFLMASHYYQQLHYREAAQWLDQALVKHDNTVRRDLVLELAVLSYCFSGDTANSATTLSLLLRDFPKHKPSADLVKDWQVKINSGCRKAYPMMTKARDEAGLMPPDMIDDYNRLCQGNGKMATDLKCRYVHYNKTHLRLAPFRLEELQIDPPVVMFHDVINEVEIQEAKHIVYNELEKSKLLSTNGLDNQNFYRTSETAWIYDGESNILDRLSRKIEDMTNLDTRYGEAHQITRYGLGMEYLYHIDYLGESRYKRAGDRLATLMFYLSDVPRGGHTIFYNWQLSVKPQKGSALLWFNLHPNGTGDESTIHAGCTVLQGTKWVLNKWFRELNNDVTRPCPLDSPKSHKYFYL